MPDGRTDVKVDVDFFDLYWYLPDLGTRLNTTWSQDNSWKPDEPYGIPKESKETLMNPKNPKETLRNPKECF